MRRAAWPIYALGALTGLLYFLSFPPYGIAALGWLALLPLVLAVRRAKSFRQAFLAGGAAGAVACIGGYFWIADMAHRFWSVNWTFAALLLALFGTFGEIVFPIFAGLAWLLRRRLSAWPAAATAGLFAVCEIVVPKIFPDTLGHSQIDMPAVPFAAALVGARGLSFFVAWIAVGLAWYGEQERRSRAQRRAEIVVGLLAVAALAAFGWHRQTTLRQQTPERRLDVAVVQSNLGDPEEVAAQLGSVTRAVDSTVTLYLDLTRRALADRRADLVVWPETAMPSVPREALLARLRQLVRDTGTTLIFGAYDVERRDLNRVQLYNAAFLMPPPGDVRQRYYKHKLLLLGEYVPFSDRFPWLLNILPSPGEFTPGPGPRPFQVGKFSMSPLICYELLFPSVVRRSLRAGGTDVLVNLTNDYWFGKHGEPWQHLALCRMCALEFGRPIVRATNTGISALIDASGQVLASGGLRQQAVLQGTLPVPEMRWTAYARWGDWLVLAAIALALGVVGLVWKALPVRAEAAPEALAATAGGEVVSG